MKLVELIKALKNRGLLIKACGRDDLEIVDLTYDSRRVKKGSLFVCKGEAFKREYLTKAIEAGAVIYLSENDYEQGDLPFILVSDIRLAMAVLSDTFYKSPYEAVPLIGITGTKGKSTTTMFLEAVLNEAYQPKKVGLTSSLRVYDGTVDEAARLTTPESLDLFFYLSNARENKLPAMLVEVSSQALKYHRTSELSFAHGIFLNIGQDHISPVEHPDFEDYFESKLLLFEQCQKIYVNLDSDFADKVLLRAKAHAETITFALDKASDYRAYDLVNQYDSIHFRVKSKAFDAPFTINVMGRFNVSNALACIAVACEMGLEVGVIQKGLKKASLTGRMEVIKATNKNPKIIVDYAHNKLSFESVLADSKKEAKGKLWVLFGAPGGKAKNRRHDLGEVASLYADHVILTTDDAYNEDAEAIAEEIKAGYQKMVDTLFIRDRKEAIDYVISKANVSDTVLLLGKGAEVVQKMASGNLAYEGDYNNAILACAKRGKGL